MNIAELIAELRRLPPDLEVVLSKDAEGNNFSPLEDCTRGHYEPDSTYSGEFVCLDEGTAVCLWPVN